MKFKEVISNNPHLWFLLLVGNTLVLMGVSTNFIVIMGNECNMPYMKTDWISSDIIEYGYVEFTKPEEVNYWFFSDIIPIKPIILFSIGDLLMLTGVSVCYGVLLGHVGLAIRNKIRRWRYE